MGSQAALDADRNDPTLADLHPPREEGRTACVWHLMDKFDDLHGLLLR